MRRQRKEDSFTSGIIISMVDSRPTTLNVCIFCKQEPPTVTFVSEEHIVPQSLGNTYPELILEPGTVCDQCNSGKLALLDQALLDFLPVKVNRLIGRIVNKRNEHPVVKSANSISMQYTDDKLHVTVPNSNKVITTKTDGSVAAKIILRANKMTPKKTALLARSLFKILFESATKQHGIDWALLPKNDAVRDVILNGVALRHGFVATEATKTHDTFFRIDWHHIPPFVGLHNTIFTVGLFGEDIDIDEIKEEAIKNKYSILFF